MTTENNHGTGAVIVERNQMVANFGEIVADSPLFDWGKGYDVRLKINKDFKTKDQNGSGSCGGQASSYLTEAAYCLTGSTIVEGFSARSIYSRCFVPGGGSSEQGLMNVLTNHGVDAETEVVSYENGLPPSEAFMETIGSTTTKPFYKGARPVYVDLTFDKIATAVLQNGGVVIGIHGQNNGTWLSVEPTIPTLTNMRDPNVWHHWVYVGFAGMRNGRKCLGFKNSWGNIGDNGWQYIYEDYMPYIFCAWSMVYTKNTWPKHVFNTSLKLGQSSKEVVALQDVLRYEGLFNNVSTGYYGPLTASAVDAFQRKYAVDTIANLNILQGKQVGPKTLKKLNELYN